MRKVKKGNVTMKIWDLGACEVSVAICLSLHCLSDVQEDNQSSVKCGTGIVEESTRSCQFTWDFRNLFHLKRLVA